MHRSLDHIASERQERIPAVSFVSRDLSRSEGPSDGETPVVHRCAPSRLAKDYESDLKSGLFLVVLNHALVLLWLLAPVLVACSASDIALLRYTLPVQLYFV